MKTDLREHTKKAVGGSLSELPPLQRLETLRQNAAFLRGGSAKLPIDDGTLVRKTAGERSEDILAPLLNRPPIDFFRLPEAYENGLIKVVACFPVNITC